MLLLPFFFRSFCLSSSGERPIDERHGLALFRLSRRALEEEESRKGARTGSPKGVVKERESFDFLPSLSLSCSHSSSSFFFAGNENEKRKEKKIDNFDALFFGPPRRLAPALRQQASCACGGSCFFVLAGCFPPLRGRQLLRRGVEERDSSIKQNQRWPPPPSTLPRLFVPLVAALARRRGLLWLRRRALSLERVHAGKAQQLRQLWFPVRRR